MDTIMVDNCMITLVLWLRKNYNFVIISVYALREQ